MAEWLDAWLTFIRLGRPHFLAGGVLLYGLGVITALCAGTSLNLPALLWGQVAVTATQWMTHYSNEYFDLPADRMNPTPTRWAGGSRVLVEGRLSPHVALLATGALGSVALTAMMVVAFRTRPGPLALPLLLTAFSLALGYSAPPLQLHSRGLGEATVAFVVPGLTPLVGYYLQAGRLDRLPLLMVVPLCCLQFAMLLAIEFPDAVGDALAGKRTLVVRLGGARAARLYGMVVLLAYASLPLLVRLGLPPPVALAAAWGAPLALWQVRRVLGGAWSAPQRWDSLALWSIVLLMGTAVAEGVAALWLLGRGLSCS